MSNFKPFSVRFIKSALDPKDFPHDDEPEIAFIGRSNSGKSSTLNRLSDVAGVARVSKTPGRTQLINFFSTPHGRFVDLPGYGYARASRNQQRLWTHAVDHFLEHRDNLSGLVMIVDVRHPMQPMDQQMLTWCIDAEIALLVLLNKSDKTKQQQRATMLEHYRASLATHKTAHVQLFSALEGTGLVQAKASIEDMFGR